MTKFYQIVAGIICKMSDVVATQPAEAQGNNGGIMIGLTVEEGPGKTFTEKNNINGNGAHNGERNIIIRPYCAQDRPAIRRICCDTGFLGNPVETIFTDREIFADLFTEPYLHHESDWAWVAENGEGVIGYLLGSVSPKFQRALLLSGFQTTMKMLARAATGRYTNHPRTKKFIRWLLTSGYWEQPKHPEHAAHLHFDIQKNYRGAGLAWRLWLTYEEKLRAAGVKCCYGAFFSWPKRRPESIYTRFGFSVYDRKPTTIFQPEISEQVEVVCVQKELGE
jgi:GNAT superfamily N-acetyltransferase